MRLLAVPLLLFTVPAGAQMRPTPGVGDARLQTVVYDPEQVVQLEIAGGYQLMVSFAPGEHIETIAVGDSAGWQVTANKRGDYLFVKAVQPGGNSNLTVVSDTHVYSFELVRATGWEGSLPYAVRFLYPEPAAAEIAASQEKLGLRYRMGGARAIRPSSIAIEGDNAVIEWPPKTSLPAVFQVDGDGHESLVNGEMREGRYIVGGAPSHLVFRLDRLKATAQLTQARKGSR